MFYLVDDVVQREPCKKGKLMGQMKPLKLKEIWSIRVRLQMADDERGLALSNLAIDSKLRACDLVSLKVSDIANGSRVLSRATVMQRKTQQRVQFEITEDTRESVSKRISVRKLFGQDYLFPSRVKKSAHLSTSQYSRIVDDWVTGIGLDRIEAHTELILSGSLKPL